MLLATKTDKIDGAMYEKEMNRKGNKEGKYKNIFIWIPIDQCSDVFL